MKEDVACTEVNVAAAQSSRGTIQCCSDVRFASVGAHLLDGEREVESEVVVCTVAFTYVV